MKSLYLLVSCLIEIEGMIERKVPPRTPDERLRTLQKFLGNWIEANISDKRPARGEHFAERKFFGEGDPDQSTLLSAYTAVDPTYGMPKCSYYNPNNLNHGGPRLSNEPAHTDRKQMKISRHRLRRTAVSDDELETELATQESLVRRLPEDGGPGAQDLGRRLYESAGVIRGRGDFFDILELAYEMGRSMTAFERLSRNPDVAWQQLRTGYLKWIARYTADCPREREHQGHSLVIIEYFEKLKMLRDCLAFNIVPMGREVKARVQFIYGENTPYRAAYKTIHSLYVPPINCNGSL